MPEVPRRQQPRQQCRGGTRRRCLLPAAALLLVVVALLGCAAAAASAAPLLPPPAKRRADALARAKVATAAAAATNFRMSYLAATPVPATAGAAAGTRYCFELSHNSSGGASAPCDPAAERCCSTDAVAAAGGVKITALDAFICE